MTGKQNIAAEAQYEIYLMIIPNIQKSTGKCEMYNNSNICVRSPSKKVGAKSTNSSNFIYLYKKMDVRDQNLIKNNICNFIPKLYFKQKSKLNRLITTTSNKHTFMNLSSYQFLKITKPIKDQKYHFHKIILVTKLKINKKCLIAKTMKQKKLIIILNKM